MKPEKNKRLAQTRLADGTVIDREWMPSERYMLYASGWTAGAGIKAIDPKREGLGAYDRGYQDGVAARQKAIDSYCKEIGHKPSFLRTADPSGSVGDR